MIRIFPETRMSGLSDGEEIMTLAFFVLIQYRSVTDRQTDGHSSSGYTSACIVCYNALVKMHRFRDMATCWPINLPHSAFLVCDNVCFVFLSFSSIFSPRPPLPHPIQDIILWSIGQTSSKMARGAPLRVAISRLCCSSVVSAFSDFRSLPAR